MKKLYVTLCALVAFTAASNAQTQCFNGRYESDVYTALDSNMAVTYGSNITNTGATDVLTFDEYEPAADTSKARPLIIWVHGGSFLAGSSADQDVTSLSHHFAKKGFVCVSINYRLGMSNVDSTDAIEAVIRAVQDLKATIRFFYKDRKTTNTYKIDTNNIFIGGASAGALTVDHAAYLTRDCQIVDAGYITQAELDTLGGLEGTSGNAGYSDKIKACISLCGGLGIYGWLEAGDVPLCSMHGTADKVVIYGRGYVNPGIPILIMDGDRILNTQARKVGVQNNFYTWLGAPHVPFDGTTATELAYMDTTVNFVRDFLIGQLGCTNPPLQPADAVFGKDTLEPFTACPVGIASINGSDMVINAYPNPSNNKVTIQLAEGQGKYTIQLSDISGRVVSTGYTSQSEYIIEKAGLTAGVYFLKVTNTKGETTVKKIIFY
jgi:para-nitrobenzyl esterase